MTSEYREGCCTLKINHFKPMMTSPDLNLCGDDVIPVLPGPNVLGESSEILKFRQINTNFLGNLVNNFLPIFTRFLFAIASNVSRKFREKFVLCSKIRINSDENYATFELFKQSSSSVRQIKCTERAISQILVTDIKKIGRMSRNHGKAYRPHFPLLYDRTLSSKNLKFMKTSLQSRPNYRKARFCLNREHGYT